MKELWPLEENKLFYGETVPLPTFTVSQLFEEISRKSGSVSLLVSTSCANAGLAHAL